MVRAVLILAAIAAAVPAAAVDSGNAPRDPLIVTAVRQSPLNRNRLDPLDGEEWATTVRADRPFGDTPPFTATSATSQALFVPVFNNRPVWLSIEPLAGRRAFDTIRRARFVRGRRLTTSSNVLGVGMTASRGVELTRHLALLPFASLDYDRIDSARIVNPASPHPFLPDNADSGLTGTIGARLGWRIGSNRRLRLGAYGALVLGTASDAPRREVASVGARVVQTIGASDLQPVYADTGASLSYALAPGMRLSAAAVQTVNRRDGDALAARLALRMRY